MINDLFANDTAAVATTEFARIHRDAIWWSNLHNSQAPINIYRSAEGRFFLSKTTAAGTLIATVYPNSFYGSGVREEWRVWQMHLGDRRW